MRVLVAGATGYVGSLLVPALLARGHEVTCLLRRLGSLPAPWHADVRRAAGDAGDRTAVAAAAEDADVAVYLVHGLAASPDGLAEREAATARAFAEGLETAGISHVVYLGGLVDEDGLARTSEHLYARYLTGRVLRRGPVPVTELRAGIVLGSGSASFELLRLAARQRVRPVAWWARSRTQPVAERDLLRVLVAAVEEPDVSSTTLDVGGPEVVTYGELVAVVRAATGHRVAREVRLPGLSPEVAGLLASVTAGLEPSQTMALLASARVDAVVRDGGGAEARFPGLMTTPIAAAVRRAL